MIVVIGKKELTGIMEMVVWVEAKKVVVVIKELVVVLEVFVGFSG